MTLEQSEDGTWYLVLEDGRIYLVVIDENGELDVELVGQAPEVAES